ncbi:MAG: hypothetical protein ACI4V1_08075 [Eubacteriales bacterium]
MELNIFMRELESALIERGIPGETAKKHVSNLRRTFTSDDLSEIEAIHSGSEVEQLADSIALILKKNTRNTVVQPAQPSASAPSAPAPAPKPRPQSPPVRPNSSSAPPPDTALQRKKIDLPPMDEEDDYYTYSPGEDVTTRGMILFWVGLFLTLPITLGLAVVLFGAFAAVFIGLSALIVGLIAVLIAIAACGAGVSLVGIIFGITQLFSFLAAGIYEIGLGIMVAGAVLFVSVLLYNVAIRLLPWLISLVGNLLGWVCGKLKNLFFVVRRECYKL